MCGILGWIGHRRPEDSHRFGTALDKLAHRGPDDRGVWESPQAILGHRRLSIIDLTQGGHQPMSDPPSGNVLVYNGEIYNYIELRNELKALGDHFSSDSDSEVLLRAFMHYGNSVLSKLNGMWAFSIWDSSRRRLFFSRDRFGVKPFYFVHNESFAFASEPKALLELFPQKRAVSNEALFDFLEKGLLYTNGLSFYKGIRSLPPAHCGVYDAESNKLQIWRYWDYPDHQVVDESPGEAAQEFAALLDSAIQLRLRSDVPVGVTLSGGLDSTAVLAGSICATQSKRFCFTSVYGGSERGEAPWAKTASKPYGINPVEVEAPKDQWLDTLKTISWHMDGPGYSPAVYPLWCLMKEARQHGVPVLLEGQGADEALGGYPQYAILDFMVRSRAALGNWSDGIKLYTVWNRLTETFTARWATLWLIRENFPFLIDLNRRRYGAGATLRPEFSGQFITSSKNDYIQPPHNMDRVMTRMWFDHSRNVLPGLLHYGDSVSMAHSIETRLPFMDYRLVEWAFMRGINNKILEGQTKWILREYLRGKGQNAIASRTDKKGYPTPVDRWLANNNGALARDILMTRNARIHEYCEPKAISRLIGHLLQGRASAGNHLYRLISTEMWLQSTHASENND